MFQLQNQRLGRLVFREGGLRWFAGMHTADLEKLAYLLLYLKDKYVD